MSFALNTFQIVLFSEDLASALKRDKSSLRNAINTIVDEKQISETILPIPEDAPDEIPRMILNESNSNTTFTVYRNKLEISFSIDEQNMIKSFISNIKSRLIKTVSLFETENMLIDNVGIIIRSVDIDPKATKNLTSSLSLSFNQKVLKNQEPINLFIRAAITDDIKFKNETKFRVSKNFGLLSNRFPNKDNVKVISEFDINTLNYNNDLTNPKTWVEELIDIAYDENEKFLNDLEIPTHEDK